jgi:hypothetical protein
MVGELLSLGGVGLLKREWRDGIESGSILLKL